MRESSLPVALHSAILIPAQSSLQMVWLNPARSFQSQFQETIVPRVIRVSHVLLRHLQSAKRIASAKVVFEGQVTPMQGSSDPAKKNKKVLTSKMGMWYLTSCKAD